jgi:hypothetical protein
MQVIPAHLVRRWQSSRVLYGIFTVLCLMLIAFIVRERDVSVWYAVAFAVAPDLALLAGYAPGLAKGQLHPRAVLLYNALHSFVGPVLLGIAALLLGDAWLVAALAWALHISLDRCVGYGFRTPGEFQRA